MSYMKELHFASSVTDMGFGTEHDPHYKNAIDKLAEEMSAAMTAATEAALAHLSEADLQDEEKVMEALLKAEEEQMKKLEGKKKASAAGSAAPSGSTAAASKSPPPAAASAAPTGGVAESKQQEEGQAAGRAASSTTATLAVASASASTAAASSSSSSSSSSAASPASGLLRSLRLEVSPDTAYYAQLLDLGKACYVWCGDSRPEGGSLSHLLAAVPLLSSSTAAPGGAITETAITTLLDSEGGGETGSGDAEGMASRLSKRTGKMVLLSLNLPDSLEALEAQPLLEKKLAEEIGLYKPAAAGSSGSSSSSSGSK